MQSHTTAKLTGRVLDVAHFTCKDNEEGDQLVQNLKSKFATSSEVNLNILKEQATKQFSNMQLEEPVADSALQRVAMEGLFPSFN